MRTQLAVRERPTSNDSVLRARLAEAEAKLAETQEVLHAIRSGGVDAVVIAGPEGDQIFALRDTEYAYRALIEAMNEGAAMIARDDTVLYCNQRLADISRIRLEQIIGSSVSRLVALKDLPSLTNLLANSRNGILGSGVFDFPGENGLGTTVSVSLRQMSGPGTEAVCMVVTDISAHKENEHKLLSLTAFMQSILASSPIATIVTDLNGLITSVNPAAERMLEYSQEQLLHQTPLLLLDTNELHHHAAVISSELASTVRPGLEVLTAKPSRGLVEEGEWKLSRRDGSSFDAQLTVSGLNDADGNLIGLILLAVDITERKRSQAYISHLAHHDALTGLPTRTLLRDKLDAALARARRYRRKVGLLMVDIDNFKGINDIFGHQTGDAMLVAIARRLENCIRASDTVARMGGDEFIVLLDELRDADDGKLIAEKLSRELGLPLSLGEHCLSPTASIGICVYPDCADNAESLLKNADMALYRAKAEGRDRYEAFTQELAADALRKRELESNLSRALELQEFELAYQPQVAMDTGKVIGMEALLRWKSHKLGMVMPNEFIPLAEKNGLILEVGEWVIRTACREAKQLQLQLGRQLRLAVNVSPRQFQQVDLPRIVLEALEAADLDAALLELEMTENILVGDLLRPLAVLERIRSLGIRVALDDFGTGYSSMSYILRFRVDRIKIDQSFIRQMTTDPASLAVTSAVVALARALDIPVVAEGVETELHRDLLLNEACGEGQGYLYSRPVSIQDMPRVIEAIEQA